MTMRPEPYYSGPVEYMEPTYGGPYSVKEHCPTCGSIDLSEQGCFQRNDGHYDCRYMCNRCGRRFILPKFRVSTYSEDLDRKAKKKRFVINDDGRRIRREDIIYEMRDEAMDDDPRYMEVAGEYYGEYYYGEPGEDTDDASWNEWRGSLESDLPWVEAHNAVERGYIDRLAVGESYRMPDFDVTVTRVRNKKSAKAAGKKKTAKKSGKKTTVKRH